MSFLCSVTIGITSAYCKMLNALITVIIYAVDNWDTILSTLYVWKLPYESTTIIPKGWYSAYWPVIIAAAPIMD